ncbi:hypothetical protein KAU11_04080 [Candidatus Babeliales bacterium]|nr:hypothetical protein [Candidatus Babeliales bacterium]
MTEIELYKFTENLIQIEKMEVAKNLNQTALSVAAGRGEKKAISQIKKITKEIEQKAIDEDRHKKMKNGAGKMKAPVYSNDELKSLVEGNKNGRQKNS